MNLLRRPLRIALILVAAATLLVPSMVSGHSTNPPHLVVYEVDMIGSPVYKGHPGLQPAGQGGVAIFRVDLHNRGSVPATGVVVTAEGITTGTTWTSLTPFCWGCSTSVPVGTQNSPNLESYIFIWTPTSTTHLKDYLSMTVKVRVTGTNVPMPITFTKVFVVGQLATEQLLDGAISLPKLGMKCANGQTVQQTAQGWACAAGQAPGPGSVTTTMLDPNMCVTGEILKKTPTTWACGTDLTGGSTGWALLGNAATTAANFLGTTDANPLVLKVNGQQVGRFTTTSDPDVIFGNSANSVLTGVAGATICGGGGSGTPNTVTSDHGTVCGGWSNAAGNNVAGGNGNRFATVSGGTNNIAGGLASSVGGGQQSRALGNWATVAGGRGSSAVADSSTVGGGAGNNASGAFSTIAGGGGSTSSFGNRATGDYSAIGGGAFNFVSNPFSTIAGGVRNTASAGSATVGGGDTNTASGGGATVAGGLNNAATSSGATIGGGLDNVAAWNATVAGGRANHATGFQSFIGGGTGNIANWGLTTIGGGERNEAALDFATVGGGAGNKAFNIASTASGGQDNIAYAENSAIGGGSNNRASGPGATVPGGMGANATHHGEVAHASGLFAIQGDAQHMDLVLRATNVGCTQSGGCSPGSVPASELYLDNSALRATMPVDSAWSFTVHAVARDTAGNAAAFTLTCSAWRVGPTASLIQPCVTTMDARSTGASAWTFTVGVDGANAITLTGAGGSPSAPARWVANMDITQAIST